MAAETFRCRARRIARRSRNWKLEARLTEALAKISDAPVPSNFTARVLAAIELEEAQAERCARLDMELAIAAGRASPWPLRY